MSLQRGIRVTVWGTALLFLLTLALRDLQLDRKLVLEARMDRATPYLSTLGPPARVELARDGVRMTGEPVYVNLRIPRWFRSVMVELEYDDPGARPLKLGVRTHPTQWAFEFPPPLSQKWDATTHTLLVPFHFQRAWQVERNVYRFVLSAPGVSAEQPIVIRKIRVIASRGRFCMSRSCL